MTIERLVEAVPPPALPFEPFGGPWEPIEAEIGTALPQDYKDFVRLYGSGNFMQFLGIHVPRAHNRHVEFEHRIRTICEIFREFEDSPYPYWPEPKGLLPFGGSDDGDEFFWLMRGAPEDWRVVVWDRGFQTFEVLDCDLTGFLAGLATGEILPGDFPEDLLPCDVMFESHWPRFLRRRRWTRAANSTDGALSFSWKFGAYGFEQGGISRSGLRKGG